MGVYHEEVVKKVGKEELSLILDAAQCGIIDATKMQDIADQLGRSVGGSHRTRKQSDPGMKSEPEMRNILSDWYENTIYKDNVNRDNILTEIISILRDRYL